jgi:hypothetical protein
MFVLILLNNYCFWLHKLVKYLRFLANMHPAEHCTMWNSPLRDYWKQPSCSAWLNLSFSFLTVSKISRNFTNINKLVQKRILSNLQEDTLRDNPASSRKKWVTNFWRNLIFLRNKLGFSVQCRRDDKNFVWKHCRAFYCVETKHTHYKLMYFAYEICNILHQFMILIFLVYIL